MARIPGTRVDVALPNGFTVEGGFAGIACEALEASIAVTELALSPDGVTAAWAQVLPPTIVRVSEEPCAVDGRKARMLHLRMTTEVGSVDRITTVFGEVGCAVVVVGTAPSESLVALQAALAVVLDTLVWHADAPDPRLEGLSFEVHAVAPFAVAARMGTVVLLTEGGQLGLAADAPMITIGELPARFDSVDLQQIARDHLQGLSGLDGVTVLESHAEALTHVAVASATLQGSGVAMGVFQQLRLTEASAYVVVARVNAVRFEALRPVFEAIASRAQRR